MELPACEGDFSLEGEFLRTPPGLDVVEDREDLAFRESVPERWHAGLGEVASVGNEIEQQVIAVVPGVTGGVVRGSGIGAVGIPGLPIGHALAIGPVTSRAVGAIQRGPICDAGTRRG